MIGSVIDGRYRIVAKLASGGMGSVYEAEHIGTGRRVAVKLINVAEVKLSPSVIGRFQREARVAGAIDSQHIAQVIDFGMDPSTDAPYLVMEYLTGDDLGALLERLGPLSPDLVLRIVAQACIGLQKAHDVQVIHRDIKAANIFVAKRDLGENVVKLLDFGIAKITAGILFDGESSSLTRTGGLVGSPRYMSPEQLRGSKLLDHRTDIWSLGIVFYELLANRTPFHGYSAYGELLVAICHDKLKPVRDVAPWVPPEVAAIVERALRRSPDERFPTAAAMFEAIRTLLPDGWTITDEMLVPMSAGAAQSVTEPIPSVSASAVPTPIPTGETRVIEPAEPSSLAQSGSAVVVVQPQPVAKSSTEVMASSPKGTLTRVSTGESLFLRSEMLLGRSAACDVRINELRVSSQHASLRWTGSVWEIRDLGSKNGTFVAGRRLATGERATLIARDVFSLGGPAAPAPVFCLVDAAAPVTSARSVRTGIVRIAADGLLTLPDDEHPDVCVVETRDGRWTIEADGHARVALENDNITIGDEVWILDVPQIVLSTMAVESVALTLDSISLHFAVNSDGQVVTVTIRCPDKLIHLSPQSHHQLLLALARERLRCAELPSSERGWLDRHVVCEQLGLSEQRLNVETYNARREFAALGIQGAVAIVERRPGGNSLRLGVERVEVKAVSS